MDSFPGVKHPKKRAYLKAFSICGNVSRAAAAARVDRSTIPNWRRADGKFKALEKIAEEEACDYLEDVAWKRATQGIERPVYQGGKLVGTETQYSDTLLIFTLKARRPEKFRDRYDVNHAGAAGAPLPAPEVHVHLDLSALNEDELRTYRDLNARLSGRGAPASDPGGNGTLPPVAP